MATLRICSIPNCGKRAKARGWCQNHYTRWRKHGEPLGGRTPPGDPLKWLLLHVSCEEDECLRWPFARNSAGFGNLNLGGRFVTASRVMCALKHGPAPSSIHEAAHNCGKGHEGCINPNHLRWATPQENTEDKFLHGTVVRGESHYGTILTEEAVRVIRALRGKLLQREIGSLFGVSNKVVSDIHRNRAWYWLK